MGKTNTVCALKKNVCRLYCLSMSLVSIIFTCLCVLTRLIFVLICVGRMLKKRNTKKKFISAITISSSVIP